MKIRKPKSKLMIVALIIISSFWFAHWSCAYTMSKAASSQPKPGVFIGVFREGAPRNMAYIDKYVEQVGKKPAMIMWYADWAQEFPEAEIQKVFDYGAMPQIVWEPWYWTDHEKIKLKDITSGKWDNYIRSWAKGIKKFDQPVFLRVAHEFNIEGYPWCLVHNGKDPQVYIKAYRHVVDIFAQEKVKNVKWIWCFMNYSYPDEDWNDWAAVYPGDKYVDWIGIDGYNWGTSQEWSQWQSFKQLFGDQVRKSKKLWPNKPIMIAEFASDEKGGDKPAWIKEIPDYLKSSLRDIDAILWFDVKKEAAWQIKSSEKSFQAYREIMKDPIFSSAGPALAAYKSPASVKVIKTAVANRAAKAVVIDGNLAGWDKSSPIVMQDVGYFKEGLGWKGEKDLSGKAYLMWDENNLYLAAEINDDFPLVNKKVKQDIWNGDAIEMVLSVNPEADPSRDSFASGDYQLGFSVQKDPIIWNWQRSRIPSGSQIKVKPTASPKGYILEAMIPWEFFRGGVAPAKGLVLGFDIAFDDADKLLQREKQFIWNGDFEFYKDPSVWGKLELR